MNKKCPYDIKSQSLSSLLDTLWYGIKLKELLEDKPFIFVATSSLHIKYWCKGAIFYRYSYIEYVPWTLKFIIVSLSLLWPFEQFVLITPPDIWSQRFLSSLPALIPHTYTRVLPLSWFAVMDSLVAVSEKNNDISIFKKNIIQWCDQRLSYDIS